jgi:hypothetical protein
LVLKKINCFDCDNDLIGLEQGGYAQEKSGLLSYLKITKFALDYL